MIQKWEREKERKRGMVGERKIWRERERERERTIETQCDQLIIGTCTFTLCLL